MAELAGQLQQEDALARRAQTGDGTAFDRLVELCSARVYAFAFRMVGNSEDAQDIAQEAFVRVYQAIPRFRHDAAFSTWLYRIVANTCHDELTRRKKRPVPATALEAEGDTPREAPATGDGPEDHYLRRERQQALEQALAQLPEAFRLVVVLHDVQGLPYQEIADALRIEIGTVKSRLNRGRNLLREKIAAQRELFGMRVSQSR